MSELRVVSYNARFVVDRWHERKSLLNREIEMIKADVAGLQEVMCGGYKGQYNPWQFGMNPRYSGEDSHIALPAPAFPSYFGFFHHIKGFLLVKLFLDLCFWFNEHFLERLVGRHLHALFDSAIGIVAYVFLGTAFCFGNAILAPRSSVVHKTAEIRTLGSWRVAQRVLLKIPNTQHTVWFVNVHLHSGRSQDRQECRARQAVEICEWMKTAPESDAIVIVGDFNASPSEDTYEVMKRYFLL